MRNILQRKRKEENKMKWFLGITFTTAGIVGAIASILMMDFGAGFRLSSMIGVLSLTMLLIGTVIFAQIESTVRKARKSAIERRNSMRKNRNEYLAEFKKAENAQSQKA